MYQEKYSVLNIKREETYLKVTIKKETRCISSKDFYIKENEFSNEFIDALSKSLDLCKNMYENYIGNTILMIGKSLLTGNFSISSMGSFCYK